MRADFSLFLAEMSRVFDRNAEDAERDDFLRAVGQQMAGRLSLPACPTLGALEDEMNIHLNLIGWGRVDLTFDGAAAILRLRHTGLPSARGDSPAWLVPCLEGLYQSWLSMQPGATPDRRIRRRGASGSVDEIDLEYGR